MNKNVSKSYQVSDDPKYIVPSEFVFGSHDLTGSQKKMLGFILLFVKQLRDKLYEADEINGKKATQGMSTIEKNKHFNNYYPELDEIKKHNNVLFLEWKTLEKFFDLGTHPKRIISPIIKGIVSKNTQFYDSFYDEECYLTVVPFASITQHGVNIEVHYRAIQRLCKHSLGYSDTDLMLWVKLRSNHTLNLIEVLSGNKHYIYDTEMHIDVLKRALGCDFKTVTKVQAESSNLKYGDYLLDNDGKKIPKYPNFSDFNKIVLKKAFKELLDNSDGVWTADPEFPLGYELIKSGRTVHKIRFKVRYNAKQIVKNNRDESNYDELSFDEKCSKLSIDELNNFLTSCLTEKLDFDKLKKNKNYADEVVEIYSKYEACVSVKLFPKNSDVLNNIRNVRSILNL